MWKFLLRRVFGFVVMLLIITVVLFFLRSKIPSDPIEKLLVLDGKEQLESETFLREYKLLASKYHYDLPLFYLTVVPSNYPKDIHLTLPLTARNAQKKLLKEQGFKWPKVYWYGPNNQYHKWVSNAIRGDFSISLKDGRPVGLKIREALKWSSTLMFFAMLLSILLGIPLGLWLAEKTVSRWKTLATSIGFILFAIPLFYLCTLMLMFFTTPEYGSWTNLFPSVDLVPMRVDQSYWSKLWSFSGHLILPAVCWTLHSLAYMSIQMKVSMKQQLSMQYFKTALAKGHSDRSAGKKHAFRNAMLPMITLILGAIPNALAGTVIIETIFNIPGMGLLLIDSVFDLDWNVVMGILFIIALFVMLSHLIADLLYTWADPKLKILDDA